MAEKSEFLQNLLTQAAIKRDAKKREKGREIVRKALPQMPGEPAPRTDHDAMLTNTARGIYRTNNPDGSGLRAFDERQFRNDIVRSSIEKNVLTGGRHPDAAPLKVEKEEKTSPISRNVDRNGASGTQTSPSPAKPGDLNAFADLLGSKYGIQFRGGFESNHLPSQSGYSAVDDVAMGGNTKEALAKKNGGFVETVIDGSDEKTTVYNRGEIAEGAQKGTSAVPDVGDQNRAVRVGQFDPRQRGGSQTGFNGADFSGDEPDNKSLTSGISNRSRSFLDYDGPGGSMMALRAAEASQGYIRQGGKNYAISGSKDGKREFTEFNDDGRRALVKDGNAQVSQKFLKDYMVGETDAKAAENPAVENPVDVQPRLEPNSNMGPLADTEQYGKMIDATKGMTGMGPLANGEVYGAYLDGRAPMMRDPRKK